MNKPRSFFMTALFVGIFVLPALPARGADTLIADPIGGRGVSSSTHTTDPLIFTMTDQGELVAKAGKVFTEGGRYDNVALPYLLSQPEPIPYPRWAVRQGWEGKLDLALEILPDGTVGRTKVMQSTGFPLLDQAADKAVHGWKFHPAVENGKAVVTCIQIPIFFRLEKG